MAEQFQIFLRKPGEEPTPIDVNPTDTIRDIKSRHNISNVKLFVGRKFLKNATTLQEKGVTAGMTLNAFTNKVPSGFGSMGEYLSAQKLKRGSIKSSTAHCCELLSLQMQKLLKDLSQASCCFLQLFLSLSVSFSFLLTLSASFCYCDLLRADVSS